MEIETTPFGAAVGVYCLVPDLFASFKSLWMSISNMGNVWTKITRQDVSNDSMLVDEPQPSTPPSDEVQDILVDSNNDFICLDVSFELLPDGSRRKTGGHCQKQCLTCHEWINLGTA